MIHRQYRRLGLGSPESMPDLNREDLGEALSQGCEVAREEARRDGEVRRCGPDDRFDPNADAPSK